MLNRLITALQNIVYQLTRKLNYALVWEYNITGVSDYKINAEPVSEDCPFGNINGVSTKLSIPGLKVKPVNNSKCYITFINGDSDKPFVLGFDNNEGTEIIIDADEISMGGNIMIPSPSDYPYTFIRYGDMVKVLGSNTMILAPDIPAPISVVKGNA